MQGPEFLHSSNPQLNSSPEIELSVAYLRANGASITDKPADRIAAYLAFLADPDYVNDGFLTGNEASIKRQVDFYAIKPEEVPQSHFKREARIAQEAGQGFVQYSKQQKTEMATRINHDQKASLKRWIEYLNGPFSKHEAWFKFYVLNGVVKLGDFDQERQGFNRRTKNSTGMFADLNPEAVSMVHDAIIKRGNDALSQMGFGKLYANELRKQIPMQETQRQITDGSWKLYESIGDQETAYQPVHPAMYHHPTVFELTRSLQGKATGWCTAGEADAAAQLNQGDFYVYYSKDSDNKDTIPRVAIRLDADGYVEEVRGVDAGQQVEPIMLDIAQEKLQKLQGGSEYFKKVADMKTVTRIYDAVLADPACELSRQDLYVLYEIDGPVGGFNLTELTDPRIVKIRQLREAVFVQDARRMFNLHDDLSVAEQLLTDSWGGVIRAYDSEDYAKLTTKEKQLLFCHNNFTTLVRTDSDVGQQYIFDYVRRQDDWFKERASKIIFLSELGVISKQKAQEALFKDNPEAIVEALREGVFEADSFPFTDQLLEFGLKGVDAGLIDLKELFSGGVLDGVIAGIGAEEAVLASYIMAGLGRAKSRDFSRVLIDHCRDKGLKLPYPSSDVLGLMNSQDKRKYLDKGNRGVAMLAVSLLELDSLLSGKPTKDKLYKHQLYLGEETFDVMNHNKLAQTLALKRPDILTTFLEDLRKLNNKTFGMIADAGLSVEALGCLGSFAKDVDHNQVIMQAIHTNPKSIHSVESVLEKGRQLRPEIVEALTDAAACGFGDLIQAYDSFTPEAQAEILKYVCYESPLTLLHAKEEQGRFPNRDQRFYSDTIQSYVSESFVEDIDYDYLFSAMISVPTNCRLAIINRNSFPDGVFDDHAVIKALQGRQDNRTLYWALDKDLLNVSDDQKQQIMQGLTADPKVQAYINRDKSFDVPITK